MKRTMVVATFLMVGAGVLGVGAPPLQLRGSDALTLMINDVLAIPGCGGAVDDLVYIGGGSSNASSRMRDKLQEAAPMTSFLSTGSTSDACLHQTAGANARGIIWALEGLSMVGSKANVTACGASDGFGQMRHIGAITVYDMNEDGDGTSGDGDIDCPAGVTCSPTYALVAGAANAWKDVLNVLYFGVHNNNRGSSSSAIDGAKMCNSDVRYSLAGVYSATDAAAAPAAPAGYNAYSENFQGGCAGGGCTRIEHLWRRGDDSGTTDTFQSLVCGSASDPDCGFCNNNNIIGICW